MVDDLFGPYGNALVQITHCTVHKIIILGLSRYYFHFNRLSSAAGDKVMNVTIFFFRSLMEWLGAAVKLAIQSELGESLS